MRNFINWIVAGMMLALVGCTPIGKLKAPLAACPLVQKAAAPDNGTIFQATAIRPLFEDQHARNVGDELTIVLSDITAQTEKSAKNAGKSEAVKTELPSKAEKSGGSNGSSAFSGEIIATVIVVMDSGKLLVCGDKLVKYASGETDFEYIRFSGTISPSTISAKNTVLSTQVADVQIEYRNAGSGDSPYVQSTSYSRLSRFFMPKKLYF